MKRILLLSLLLVFGLNPTEAQKESTLRPYYFSAHGLPIHLLRENGYGYSLRMGYRTSPATTLGLRYRATRRKVQGYFTDRNREIGLFMDYQPFRSKRFDVVLGTEAGFGQRSIVTTLNPADDIIYPYVNLVQYLGARFKFNPYLSIRLDAGFGGDHTFGESSAIDNMRVRFGLELTL